MGTARHDIAEHDVVVLLKQKGNWPAGTEGTAVSIYEDAVLVDLSHMPMEDPVDNLVTWPANEVKIVWRRADHPSYSVEAAAPANRPSADPQA